ncbi:MAG TPA: hypothetical protein VF494_11220 [Candidatus Limnocylindrales bacterium]
MHPRTREVRRPDSGIDPRGSGSGQPPLLQGFLKHRKPAAAPKAAAPERAEPAAPNARPAAKVPKATAKPTPKPRKRIPNTPA